MCLFTGADSRMDKQRRLRLAEILKSKGDASAKRVGGSIPPTSETTPTSPTLRPQDQPSSASPPALSPPNSPPPTTAMPLALAETPVEPAPLAKGKGVVAVPSDDEGDSAEGQVFKRRRTSRAVPQVATSTTSSSHGAESLRENPPSATSPSQPMTLEGGLGTEPTSAPPPTPELPPPMQDSLRGYLEKMSPCGQAEGPKKEEKEVASLKDEKERLAQHWACKEVAYKDSLKIGQKAKEDASKRLHEVGQAHAELLNQVVPLRVKIVELEDATKAYEAQQKKLEAHCVDREQTLRKTEGELAAKIEAFNLLQAENGKLQADVNKLQVEKEFLDKQLATKNSKIEELEKSNKELLDDMAGTFEEGFKAGPSHVRKPRD
ncbi:WEB family protein At5g16730, chloroplastic-like [Phaseolus vulgaris]|uniref:WEB family protein At5g16730, chloroplastic-like n=1 Tax=Phaseolus vulgaris TaxID=3885 RepID=UPI0035CBB70B